jgi:replicative DNA helicase
MPDPAQPLPQSPEAEASLLGALLLDPSQLEGLRQRLRSEDFSRESHRRVYRAICELADTGREPTFQSVTEALRSHGELDEVGGPAALVGLIEGTPAAAHVRGYASIVERTAILRRLIGAAQGIMRLALTAEDADEAVRRSQQLLFDVSETRLHREVVTVGEALRELFTRIDLANERGRGPALPTGFPNLDEKLGGGLHPGDLVIVAGRPGLGKTSFALNVMRNAALMREAVCAIFSLEMTEEDLTLRLLSSLAEIDGGRLRRGALDLEELQAISQASSQLMHRGIFIEECTRLGVTDVLTHARKLQAREGLDLIVIDYIQLMEGVDIDNRVQEIGSISRGLKAIARELNVPVVVLSQLSRQIERRTGGEPKLSDLRESGALEQDADIVLFLWRREREREPQLAPILELRLAKHRNGPTGDFQLVFEHEYTRFRELPSSAA